MYALANCVAGISVVILVVSIVCYLAMKESYDSDGQDFFGRLILVSFVAICISMLVGYLGEEDYAIETAKEFLAEDFNVSVNSVTIGYPTCEASRRSGCEAWQASFTVRTRNQVITGVVHFDTGGVSFYEEEQDFEPVGQ